MSRATYSYRRLTSADVSLLKSLLAVFGEAFGEVERYQNAVPSDAYLARLLGRPHVIVVVAQAGETVVGGLTAYVLEKFEQDRREVYIYDLAVRLADQRRGVATNLIRELQGIAAVLDAYVIFVQADPEDEPAIALYEALGTRQTAYHFDIAVGPGARRHRPTDTSRS